MTELYASFKTFRGTLPMKNRWSPDGPVSETTISE